MAMTKLQATEFKLFCHRDGLSPSGTHAQLWEQARPLGLLLAIWAVHHGEMPSAEKIDELSPLERYARPLLPAKGAKVDGTYLTNEETAEALSVTLARVRQLVAEERIDYVETPLGRFFSPESIARYLKNLGNDGRSSAGIRAQADRP